jgi:hypothetical protein
MSFFNEGSLQMVFIRLSFSFALHSTPNKSRVSKEVQLDNTEHIFSGSFKENPDNLFMSIFKFFEHKEPQNSQVLAISLYPSKITVNSYNLTTKIGLLDYSLFQSLKYLSVSSLPLNF